MMTKSFFALLYLCVLCVFATAQESSAAADEALATKENPAAKKESQESVSVVLLQTRLPELSEDRLVAMISKAWQIKIVAGVAKGEKEYVRKDGPDYLIQTKEARFIVIIDSKPYASADDIKSIRDLRSRKMLEDHRSWISVDFLPDDKDTDFEMVRKTMLPKLAKLAAELVDRNTVGLLLPSEEILLPRTEDLPSLLRAKDPVAAVRDAANVPVVNASDDEPEMKKAVTEARKSWPQFLKAFKRKAANTESYGVKFPFDAPGRKEFMWVEVTAVDGEFVTGFLANDPVWATDLKLGDEVRKKVSEISDWMYIEDGEMVGGFSVKVLLRQQEAQGKAEEEKAKSNGK